MPYKYYEATHHEFDPKLGEYSYLEWTSEIPIIGEQAQRVSDRTPFLKENRLWEVVALDEYKLADQTQPEFEADPVVFLNHCALRGEILPERSTWARVEMFQENPLTILHLFVSPARELIQSSIHFYGKRSEIGSYLKQYDYQKREFVKLPWRVSRMDTYLPSSDQYPLCCYATIHIAHCVQVSRASITHPPSSENLDSVASR